MLARRALWRTSATDARARRRENGREREGPDRATTGGNPRRDSPARPPHAWQRNDHGGPPQAALLLGQHRGKDTSHLPGRPPRPRGPPLRRELPTTTEAHRRDDLAPDATTQEPRKCWTRRLWRALSMTCELRGLLHRSRCTVLFISCVLRPLQSVSLARTRLIEPGVIQPAYASQPRAGQPEIPQRFNQGTPGY